MKHARNGGPDIAFRLGRRVVSTVADDMSTVQRVGAGVVAALVAVSPFGAWNEVEAQAEPLTAGTPVEVGPFDVTVVKAATATELGYLVPAAGNHLLGVVVEVTNTTDVPEYSVTLGDVFPAPENVGIIPEVPLEELGTETGTGEAASGVGADPSAGLSASPAPEDAEEPELPSATIFNVKDATDIRIFNPGVTYRVVLIWEQSDEFAGKTIPLEMVELEWIEESALSLDNEYWLPGETAFKGQIKVEPVKSEAGADAEAAQ